MKNLIIPVLLLNFKNIQTREKITISLDSPLSPNFQT